MSTDVQREKERQQRAARYAQERDHARRAMAQLAPMEEPSGWLMVPDRLTDGGRRLVVRAYHPKPTEEHTR